MDTDDDTFISLFLQSRFYSGKMKNTAPQMDAVHQAWNAFSDNYLKNPARWRKKLLETRNNFTSHSESGL
jgi:hypothetical protein